MVSCEELYPESTSNCPSSSSVDSTNNSLKSIRKNQLSRSRSGGGIFSNPFNPFKSDRDKMDQLTELLNQYSTHGIPENNCNRLLQASSQLTLVPSSTSSVTSLTASTITSASPSPVPVSTTTILNPFHHANVSSCKQHQHQHQHQQQQQSSQYLHKNSDECELNFDTTIDSITNALTQVTLPSNLNQVNINDEFYLEENWRQIVKNGNNLDKKTQGQQDALWELITTEVFYIKRLKVVTDLFLACLISLQCECLLSDIDSDKMFSNISDVYAANIHFWNCYLFPMLQASRETGQPLDHTYMVQGFLKFDQIFHPYIQYCLDHSKCLTYVKDKHKENELFKAYLVWCETRKDCERLRLMDLLVKPMQRLTKYSLLLKAIMRNTESEGESLALKRMNEYVEQFVLTVDASLRRKHEEDRLCWIASRIESYEAIDISSDEIEKVS